LLRRGFLAQHRNLGRDGLQARGDDALRRQIGLRQRRTIVLERDVEGGPVDSHDLLARYIGDIDDCRQPVRQLLGA
jgi:hypothetical protein